MSPEIRMCIFLGSIIQLSTSGKCLKKKPGSTERKVNLRGPFGGILHVGSNVLISEL